ncbi:hypothetical protein FPZ42_00625 [Mucilaginibacter achroorhodeus]|uniref:Pentapeptide repeat protein n=1 Tax=Mucilaginibacter achroorhodeus TaxID=2599294 RepID=A0A563U8N6_9SPHI|nr:hypothetical protein [Mucilaginibacter achroorhodeus]TWR27751.1 hypothetical protein FPZ42_00625 [Mucilaginibacter achroorhodeus]
MNLLPILEGMLNAQPTHNISALRAIDLINEGIPIVDTYVQGNIDISFVNSVKELSFFNCIVESFLAEGVEFAAPMKLINTHFKSCQFRYAYFLNGLTIENCVFDQNLSFESGGHNQPNYPVIIKGNVFNDRVDFFDCWFRSSVIVTENNFLKGTNIQSKNQMITFDIEPTITNNIGDLSS